MEKITNINFWLTGLGTYVASIVILTVFLKLKAGNAINFRTAVILVIWITNIIFISKSVELIGQYYDKISGSHMYFQAIGLFAGLAISALISWFLTRFILGKFYNSPPAPVCADTFSFPRIADRQFEVYVYRYYLLFVICFCICIFGLPLLIMFLAKEGYFDFIASGIASAIIPYTVPFMFVLIPVSIVLLSRQFRRRMLISVNAYGVALSVMSSDKPLVSLMWTDIEKIQFKLSKLNGTGVLAAYAGNNILLQLNCWGRAVKNTFIQPNELRSFSNFLLATFEEEYIEVKYVFGWAIAGGNVTEIKNKYYKGIKPENGNSGNC